jgi:uncharacterized protein (TIGR02271 family)
MTDRENDLQEDAREGTPYPGDHATTGGSAVAGAITGGAVGAVGAGPIGAVVGAIGGAIAGAGAEKAMHADEDAELERSGHSADEKYVRTDDRVDDRANMVLHEEQLTARTTPVQTGEVVVEKEVVRENRTVEVPVTREEVVIDRRPVTGSASDGDFGNDRQEIRVPVHEDHVEVEKRTVATEEISVGKKVTHDTETVSDTVRREEARIREDGDTYRV